MNETVKIPGAVNPAGSSGYIVRQPVPSAVETLEHLEQTLDNLDPVVPATPATVGGTPDELAAAMDKGADSVIADIVANNDADADVIADAASVPEGTLETIGGPDTIDPERAE